MPINPANSTSSASSVYASSPFSTNAKTMSPEQIIALCSRVLNNLGDQLNDYKNQVMARNDRQTEIRNLQAQLRDMTPGGGDLKGYDEGKYNEFMTRLAKLLPDEKLQKTYDLFLESYGGYHSTEDVGDDKAGQVVGTMAGAKSGDNQDMLMNAAEMENAGKNLADALTDLNSDNELTSMNLQQIMQQRNQASQLYSGIQNSMNETMKSIIGKIG